METKQKINRVALITGGSRGMGSVIAKRLAKEGFDIAIGYNTDEKQANVTLDIIRKTGRSGIALKVNVADPESVARFFQNTVDHFGGVDVVVHAAGILYTSPIAEVSIDQMDTILNTNLRGTLLINRQAAKQVRSGGAIINLSSAITENLAPGYGVYAVSKAGLEALTKVLSKELGHKNITVNVVAPGPTETDMLTNDLNATGNSEAYRDAIIGMTPLGRIGKPEDAAELVAALAGPLRWVTGQVIHNSGGIAIK